MANQLNFQYTAGVSLYALVYKPDFSQVYNSVTQLFESINPSNYADYALFLNEFSTLASESYYYASSEGAMSDTVNYPVVICIYPASGIATSGDTSVGTGVMGPGIDFSQALDETAVGATVGGALNAMRVQGFGKWAIVGTTLNLYASNGSTIVKSFTLDSDTAPTSRS